MNFDSIIEYEFSTERPPGNEPIKLTIKIGRPVFIPMKNIYESRIDFGWLVESFPEDLTRVQGFTPAHTLSLAIDIVACLKFACDQSNDQSSASKFFSGDSHRDVTFFSGSNHKLDRYHKQMLDEYVRKRKKEFLSVKQFQSSRGSLLRERAIDDIKRIKEKCKGSQKQGHH